MKTSAKNIRTGEELAIPALKKELARLTQIAEKAKAECEENVHIGSEAVAIHDEFVAIVKSKETGQAVIDKLDSLQKRRERVLQVMSKSIVDLSDKQFKAEAERDNLLGLIRRLEYRATRC